MTSKDVSMRPRGINDPSAKRTLDLTENLFLIIINHRDHKAATLRIGNE